MSSNISAIWLGGGAEQGGGYGTIQDGYADLISSAGVFSQTGAKVFRVWSSLIDMGSERLVQAGVITEAQRQQNFKLLQDIGTYCRANGIALAVEDNFLWTPAWTADWVNTAKAAGLPIGFVDGGENIINVANTPSALTALATTMVADAKVVAAAFPKVQFGDIEPPVTPASQQGDRNNLLTNWWNTYNAVAKQAGIAGFSYFLADIAWDGANTTWQGELEQISKLTTSAGLQLGAFINGYSDDVTS